MSRNRSRRANFTAGQKQLFEQGTKAFESQSDSTERQPERKLGKLQNVVRDKDEVMAEVAAEMVRPKEESGGA